MGQPQSQQFPASAVARMLVTRAEIAAVVVGQRSDLRIAAHIADQQRMPCDMHNTQVNLHKRHAC